MENPSRSTAESERFEHWPALKKALRQGFERPMSRYDALANSTLILMEAQPGEGDCLVARLSWYDGREMRSAETAARWEQQSDGSLDLVWDAFPAGILPLALLVGDLSFAELSERVRRPIENRLKRNWLRDFEEDDIRSLKASSVDVEEELVLSGATEKSSPNELFIERLTAKDSWTVTCYADGQLTLNFFSRVELDRDLQAEVRLAAEDANGEDYSIVQRITLHPVVPSLDADRRCWRQTISFEQPKTSDGRWVTTRIEARVLQEEVAKLGVNDAKDLDDRKRTCRAVHQFLVAKEYESACFVWPSQNVRCKNVSRAVLESTHAGSSKVSIIRANVVEGADQVGNVPFDEDRFFPLWVLIDSMIAEIVSNRDRGGYSWDGAVEVVRFQLRRETEKLKSVYETEGLKALRDYAAKAAIRELNEISRMAKGVTRRDIAAWKRVSVNEQSPILPNEHDDQSQNAASPRRIARAVQYGDGIPAGAEPETLPRPDRQLDLREQLGMLEDFRHVDYLSDEERFYFELKLADDKVSDEEAAVAFRQKFGTEIKAGNIRYVRDSLDSRLKVYFTLRNFFRGSLTDHGPFLSEEEFQYVLNKRIKLEGQARRKHPTNQKVNTAIATMLLLGEGNITDDDCEFIRAWLYCQKTPQDLAPAFGIQPDWKSYCQKLGRRLHAKVLIEDPDKMTKYTCEFISCWLIKGSSIEEAESAIMQKVESHRLRNAKLREKDTSRKREFATVEFDLSTAMQQIKSDYRNLSSLVPSEYREIEFDFVSRNASSKIGQAI